MPDDYSELVPPLPIPNRTVKRLCADDSAATSVKVGHRQAFYPETPRTRKSPGRFALYNRFAGAIAPLWPQPAPSTGMPNNAPLARLGRTR